MPAGGGGVNFRDHSTTWWWPQNFLLLGRSAWYS